MDDSSGFHGGNRGSNPLGDATESNGYGSRNGRVKPAV